MFPNLNDILNNLRPQKEAVNTQQVEDIQQRQIAQNQTDMADYRFGGRVRNIREKEFIAPFNIGPFTSTASPLYWDPKNPIRNSFFKYEDPYYDLWFDEIYVMSPSPPTALPWGIQLLCNGQPFVPQVNRLRVTTPPFLVPVYAWANVLPFPLKIRFGDELIGGYFNASGSPMVFSIQMIGHFEPPRGVI